MDLLYQKLLHNNKKIKHLKNKAIHWTRFELEYINSNWKQISERRHVKIFIMCVYESKIFLLCVLCVCDFVSFFTRIYSS